MIFSKPNKDIVLFLFVQIFCVKKDVSSKKIGNNTAIEKTKTKKKTIRFYNGNLYCHLL